MQAEKLFRLDKNQIFVRCQVAALLGQPVGICGSLRSLSEPLCVKIEVRRFGVSFSVDSIGSSADERSPGLAL